MNRFTAVALYALMIISGCQPPAGNYSPVRGSPQGVSEPAGTDFIPGRVPVIEAQQREQISRLRSDLKASEEQRDKERARADALEQEKAKRLADMDQLLRFQVAELKRLELALKTVEEERDRQKAQADEERMSNRRLVADLARLQGKQEMIEQQIWKLRQESEAGRRSRLEALLLEARTRAKEMEGRAAGAEHGLEMSKNEMKKADKEPTAALNQVEAQRRQLEAAEARVRAMVQVQVDLAYSGALSSSDAQPDDDENDSEEIRRAKRKLRLLQDSIQAEKRRNLIEAWQRYREKNPEGRDSSPPYPRNSVPNSSGYYAQPARAW